MNIQSFHILAYSYNERFSVVADKKPQEYLQVNGQKYAVVG